VLSTGNNVRAARHSHLRLLDYNRRDVQATAELAFKLLAEYAKHPINLQPTKAFSPASIGKSYLHGWESLRFWSAVRFSRAIPRFCADRVFGGRTSAQHPKSANAVVYVDFLSMYPTVNSLMTCGSFSSRAKVRVNHCKTEIEQFLRGLTPEILFCQKTGNVSPRSWKLIPNGDLLPSRGKYSAASNDWQVALNYLYASDHARSEALWFSLPDVAASVLLTGKIPVIVDAFKLVPYRKLANLKSIRLGGEVGVNPLTQDLFRTVIEQRKSLPKRKELSKEDVDRLDKALKC